MTYDGLGHEENFSAGWNPWAEVPHVIPETFVISILLLAMLISFYK
jgi:hypothetical protein